MTKKSPARQQRDAEAKAGAAYMTNNKLWDELRTHGQSVAAEYAGMVASFYNEYVENSRYEFILPQDQERFKMLVASVQQGMVTYSKDYEQIAALHANRFGGVDGLEDMQEAMMIFEKYTALYQLQMGSQARELEELATIAGKAAQNQTNHASARDASVVTDVTPVGEKAEG